ncbi:MAG: DNA-3-methyladenine glycosylase [Thaumarchaeota archaeon]|nr:DNA-3-methyladenine glycosylase [Nitrososphaerota archaeon]
MGRLRRSFFSTDSPSVARELIGKRVVRVLGGEKLAGLIVEAEAYRGADDPASHAFRGKTQRTSVMFGEPGHAYVYFTYGNHWCLNLTAEPEGVPAAVLVRALEPQEGLKVMMKNRGVDKVLDVASGPGKLTRALGIGGEFNGEDLVTSKRLFLEDGKDPKRIGRSSRVGIRVGLEKQWRFFAEGSPYVSRAKPSPSRNA